MKLGTSKAKEKEIVKKRCIKNYAILIVLFLAAIGLTLYLCKWYNVYDEYQKQTPVIGDTLTEISKEELEHYVIDSPTAIIYMCTSNELRCRNFEKDFKKVIRRDDLKDQIVYINLSGVEIEEFFNEFNDNYPYKKELNSYPALIAFEDGKISKILQSNTDKSLKISQAKQFLDMYKTGE